MINDLHPQENMPTYREVAKHIADRNADTRRADLHPYFPGLSARQLNKAMENALNKGLIESVGRGLYRARVESRASMAPTLSQNAQRIVMQATKNLSSIERAWFAVVADHLAGRERYASA